MEAVAMWIAVVLLTVVSYRLRFLDDYLEQILQRLEAIEAKLPKDRTDPHSS